MAKKRIPRFLRGIELPGGEPGPEGPPGKDAEPQFTEEQVDALLTLIEE